MSKKPQHAAHAGQVYIYPLMEGGRLPTTQECAQVYAICNADRIRPLTDQVFVQAPLNITSTGCKVKYWIKTKDGQFSNDIQTKVNQAFADYLVWQKSKIGRDINPSKCDQMLIEAGAKRTDISDNTSTFEFMIVNPQSVAVLTAPALTYMGLEDE
jgi:phage-related baseplate assembly protein